VWVHVNSNVAASTTLANRWFNFSLLGNLSTAAGDDSFYQGKLQLNGHDRFTQRYSDYFRKVQNYEHHTRVPRALAEMIAGSTTPQYRHQYIYTYSFALSPEEHQPSGTCNFSRIDNAVLQLTYATNGNWTTSTNLKVFAVNYNVLRIMSGMGGLAYSN